MYINICMYLFYGEWSVYLSRVRIYTADLLPNKKGQLLENHALSIATSTRHPAIPLAFPPLPVQVFVTSANLSTDIVTKRKIEHSLNEINTFINMYTSIPITFLLTIISRLAKIHIFRFWFPHYQDLTSSICIIYRKLFYYAKLMVFLISISLFFPSL